MRRLSFFLAGTLLLTPLAAFAFYASPSALFRGIEFDGAPRAFKGEAHFHDDETYASLWFSMEMEGKTPMELKAKVTGTFDVAHEKEHGRIRFAVMAHEGSLYGKVLSVEGNFEEEKMEEARAVAAQPWVKAPLSSSNEAMTFQEWIVEALQTGGIEATEEEIQTLVDQVTDALFSMDYTRYQGGFAFSLKLSPTMVRDVFHVIMRSPIVMDAASDNDWLDADEEWMTEVQDMINTSVNLHIKVDTDYEGHYLYGKKYISFVSDDVEIVMIAQSQTPPAHVYIDVPTVTMPLQDLAADVPLLEFATPFLGVVPVEDEEPARRVDDTPTRPVMMPRRVGRTPSPTRVSRPQARCDAEPGSSEELFLMRKGLCDLPETSTYRLNDMPGKVLNPRTTRLKNPTLER